MATKTILILGGYGGTGKVLCEKLLATTDVALIIAGRDIKEARALQAKLKEKFPTRNISAMRADAADYQSLVTALQGVTLIIDATTATQHAKNVAQAAIETGADYLDFHFEQNVVRELETLEARIKESGRCFITQAGFHPGLPSAFVRYAASHLDTLTKAIIGMAMNTEIEKPESIYELVDVLAEYKVDVFKKGVWRRAGWLDFKTLDLGTRFGTRLCYPIQMEEMYAIPKLFPLKETGVYVAGFNWFVDYVVFPLAFILPAIKKGFGRNFIARLITYGLNHFSSKNRGVAFVIEAEGIKDNKPAALRVLAEHEDAYAFTAIPIMACIHQYLDGSIVEPGLWMMGHIVEPNRLMDDIRGMGVRITITKTTPMTIQNKAAPHQSFSFHEIENIKKTKEVLPEVLVASDNTKLAYYHFHGNTPSIATIVFIHGGGAHSMLGYTPLAQTLNNNFNVETFLLDLRGHGKSEGRRGDCPSPEMVWDDIATLIRRIKLKTKRPIYLAGHSSGAGLILNYSSWNKKEPVAGYFFISPELGYKSGATKENATPFARIKVWKFVINALSRGVLCAHSYSVFLNYPKEIITREPLIVTKLTVSMARALTPNNPVQQFKTIREPFGLFIGENDELFSAKKVLQFGNLPIHQNNNTTSQVIPHQNHLSILTVIGSEIGNAIVKWQRMII